MGVPILVSPYLGPRDLGADTLVHSFGCKGQFGASDYIRRKSLQMSAAPFPKGIFVNCVRKCSGQVKTVWKLNSRSCAENKFCK